MTILIDDINKSSEWIVQAFTELHKKLDYSLDSLKDIDIFFDEQTVNDQLKAGSFLEKNLGNKLFAIGAYLGQTLIKNCPGSKWITDDNDPQGEINAHIKLKSGAIIWPVQRVIKRFKSGKEESIYKYGLINLQKESSV